MDADREARAKALDSTQQAIMDADARGRREAKREAEEELARRLAEVQLETAAHLLRELRRVISHTPHIYVPEQLDHPLDRATILIRDAKAKVTS